MVNDRAIRDRLDIEFTNGGHPGKEHYIPPGEVWVGRPAKESPEEKHIWAWRQRREYALMRSGLSFVEAFDIAHKEEIERRKADRHSHSNIIFIRDIAVDKGAVITLVCGCAVRDQLDVEFTLGGNYAHDPYIPYRRIWIDDAVVEAEWPAIIAHEATETPLILQGMPYDEAHSIANQAEHKIRNRRRPKSTLIEPVAPWPMMKMHRIPGT